VENADVSSRLKKLTTSKAIMEAVGVNKDSIGCEICRPVMASILSSLYNEPVMKTAHHGNQDTNDRLVLERVALADL
jgi:nitrite reductase (NAD(P)H)